MANSVLDPLEYYARPGLMTEAQEQAGLLVGLPTDMTDLCQVVQGLLLHMLWAERYGVQLPPERRQETEIRRVAQKLRRIQKLDARPLTVARPLERRVVSECRDFSTLLCAMLRHQGVPARARCGFATYFLPGHYEDHWVCEYWQGDEGRWVMVDAQLDQFQCQVLGIQFDPLDVPPDGFLPAGKAWLLCRAGQADPEKFGIFGMHGLWFIRGDLVRDIAALNKMELLPWDSWGLADREEKDISPADLALLDQAAALTVADNRAFPALRALYENDARLRVPPVIKSYHDTGVETVAIA